MANLQQKKNENLEAAEAATIQVIHTLNKLFQVNKYNFTMISQDHFIVNCFSFFFMWSFYEKLKHALT